MTTGQSPNWCEENQHHLMAAMAVVRALLECQAAKTGSDAEAVTSAEQALAAAREAHRQATLQMSSPAALDSLGTAFALSPFEQDLLLLCAGPELDSTFPGAIAKAQGDARRVYPTFSLALAALPDAHWSALTPASPLRRWRMIEIAAGETLTLSTLRIDERILHYLTGVSYLDDRLRGLVERVPLPVFEMAEDSGGKETEPFLPESQRTIAERIVRIWSRPPRGEGWPVLQLCGEGGTNKQALAAQACAMLGLQLYALQTANLPTAAAERDVLARLWEREAALSRSALLLDCDSADGPEGKRILSAFIQDIRGMVLLTCREPVPIGDRIATHLPVPELSASEQRSLWERALGRGAEDLNGQLDRVVMQFQFGLKNIQAVSNEVRGRQSLENGASSPSLLWDICRAQARPRLEDLAQRIEPVAVWEDLILPELQIQTLHDIASHVRRRAQVYGAWGFGAKSARGLGISALFTGASGTGKTMASEVLANELRLDLYRIDLSQVVSKYIGETEKNLRRVFDAAEECGTILLFDEADAMFGKRSEVKDSHDRYANIEVSYLLQRMESYRGLAILTTNMKQALDTAFLRRIRFLVQFPFPDAAQRVEIWRRIFPKATPTSGLGMDRLARLNVAGGSIRNIALNAAFLAADAGQAVNMEFVMRAARSEYAKLEKPLTDTEIGGWK
jgi:hypothetical protein